MHPEHLRRPRRSRRIAAVALAGATAAGAAIVATGSSPAAADLERSFRHVGSFDVTDNLGGDPLSTPTSAEIVDVTDDGETVLYTDSLTGRLGFVDITDPSDPEALGAIDLPGDPTSVAVVGDQALVAVATSKSFRQPRGDMLVVDIASQTIVRSIALGGQPDSIAISPDQTFAAIALENERDEDFNGGLLPQKREGRLAIIDLTRPVPAWVPFPMKLTGLAEVAPSDPEPEYVDINDENQAVVTLQENNHVVIVDLPTRTVVSHFSAGTAAVDDVDATEEELGPQENGLIVLGEDLVRRREPDSVVWVDDEHVATANEGDYEDENGEEGGSRGFTVFEAATGDVAWDSNSSFEHEIVRAGHYPEGRSENKGAEPEGLEFATFGDRDLLFVGAERANVVGVYDVSAGDPEFLQLLPTGLGPEGIKAIPERDLLVVTAEVDGFDEDPGDEFPARSIITLFELGDDAPSYPYIESANDTAGLPIPWVALSGLSGDPNAADTVWAVSDSFLAQAWMYQVDVSSTPAVIVDRIPVGGYDRDEGGVDLEGIAARSGGGFWLASEGRNNARPNEIVLVDDAGVILDQVELPDALAAQSTNSGFEGIAVTGTPGVDEVVWVVVQREWNDDPDGSVKIGRYDVTNEEWTFALYPLDPPPPGGWIGLSEITVLPNGNVAIIERDNQIGPLATTKKLYEVDLSATTFLPYGQPLNTVDKVLLEDLLDDLDDASITIPDKVEGFAVEDDRYFIVTDNDGVDENFGETIFVELAELDGDS